MYPVRRLDTRWMNPFNTFGTSADPIHRTSFGPSVRIQRTEAERMYRHSWEARAIVDSMAVDATREWFEIVGEGDSVPTDDLMDLLEGLLTQEKTLQNSRLSRLYGGSAMILGAYDNQQLHTPLIEERVNWFGFLLVLDRWQMQPTAWYQDPSHPNFGKPSHYILQPITLGGAPTLQNFIVHESRLIRLDGGFLPIRMSIRNVGWGDSVLEPAYEALRQFGVSTQAGASLLQDFVLKVYKMQDLPEQLGSGNIDKVRERMELAAGQSSTHGYSVIGPEDELQRLEQPVQGLAKVMEMYIDYLSAAARIPKSRLFGNMSGTLGQSSADADMRTYYDSVASYQKIELTTGLKKIIRLQAYANGLPTEGWDIEWKSLWQLDEVSKSQIAANWSTVHTNYISMGVLSENEVAQSVFGGDGINFEDIQLDDKLRGADGALPEPEPLPALEAPPPED